MKILISILLTCFILSSDTYKILGIFPYDGRSHHIYYSSIMEELAKRGHEVTVINYHSMQKVFSLRQISLQDKQNSSDTVDIEQHLKVLSSDLLMAYDTAQAFKYIANTNCKKLMINKEVQELVKSGESYDVVIVEQFVTDCGLAIAHKLNAPVVGMTAHILMPWTYLRLGAPNNAAFVPNHFFASKVRPSVLDGLKSAVINFGMNLYYAHVIQKNDQDIVNEVYPDMPPLEDLGKKNTLTMLNQYFPLTGPRLYGPNVVEIGGLHIKEGAQTVDKKLQQFLDKADKGVVYISFGSVAANFPCGVIDEIIRLIVKSDIKFVWKTDVTDWTPSSNVFMDKWLPQLSVLCHPKVVAFITHSGMLSTSEAMHCGVPVVSIPLFGDQFANGASAVQSGLGVMLDITTLDKQTLNDALKTVLQETYQKRAQRLSQMWKDRPMSPMDTAVYWIEYVGRNKDDINMKPPTVNLPLHEYLMPNLLLTLVLIVLLVVTIYCLYYLLMLFYISFRFVRFIKETVKRPNSEFSKKPTEQNNKFTRRPVHKRSSYQK